MELRSFVGIWEELIEVLVESVFVDVFIDFFCFVL